jgi:hypothetical protein
MELSIRTGLPSALPAKAASRLERLGFGELADRQAIATLCGSLRAGDQFIHAWSRRGLLVPADWGRYYVPEERVLTLLLAIRSAPESRLAAWAAAPWKKLGFPRQPGFMAPTLWRSTDLAVASPGALTPLLAEERHLRPAAPQLEAFAADLGWPLRPLTLRVGTRETIHSRAVDPADVAWILSLNLDARLRSSGKKLLKGLYGPRLRRALEIRRLASFPALMPTRSAALAMPVGPPHQYRLFAPRWFIQPHLRALQSEARRRDGA